MSQAPSHVIGWSKAWAAAILIGSTVMVRIPMYWLLVQASLIYMHKVWPSISNWAFQNRVINLLFSCLGNALVLHNHMQDPVSMYNQSLLQEHSMLQSIQTLLHSSVQLFIGSWIPSMSSSSKAAAPGGTWTSRISPPTSKTISSSIA